MDADAETLMEPRSDQAESLRRMMARRQGSARIVAVVSGKGGVGRTNLAVALGVAAAQRGQRSVVVDCDLEMACIDSLLQLEAQYNLLHVLAGERSIREVAVDGPGGLRIVTGPLGAEPSPELRGGDLERLHEALADLAGESDLVLLDMPAGASPYVVEVAARADDILLVAVPEPTSVAAAYALIKVLGGQPTAPQVHLVVNMASGRREAARVREGMLEVTGRYLGTRFSYVGHVRKDPLIGLAVKRRASFLLEFPYGRSSADLLRVHGALAGERLQEGDGLLRRVASFLGM